MLMVITDIFHYMLCLAEVVFALHNIYFNTCHVSLDETFTRKQVFPNNDMDLAGFFFVLLTLVDLNQHGIAQHVNFHFNW